MAGKKTQTTIRIQTALILVLASIILTTAFVLMVVKSNPTASEAARGGKRASATYGTCSVTPNPAPINTSFTINGSGFKANQGLTLKVQSSSGANFLWTIADASGNFSQVWQSYTKDLVTIGIYDSLSTSTKALTSCTVTIS